MRKELCSELCNKKNKFKKYYNQDCDIAKISLTVTLLERDLTYSISNTGTESLCNDFYICSKLYKQKLRIENELLNENETISLTMSLNDIKNPQSNETEKARVYTKIKDRLFIVSNLIEVNFENGLQESFNLIQDLESIDPNATPLGVYITSSFNFSAPTVVDGVISCSMVNNGNSSSDATNVRFTIRYGGIFTESQTFFRRNNINKFFVNQDSDGFHCHIPLWKKNETYTFSLSFSLSQNPRPIIIPLNFYLTSDNKFGEFSNYIRVPNNLNYIL